MTNEAIALWTDTSSDPELIAGVRAGDGTAFGVLYERHVDAARKVASQYTNSVSDVDDVVAESFSRVLRALQRGDGPDLAFRAYLFTIVRRTGMDVINRGNRTRPGDDMTQYESSLGYEAPSDSGAFEGFEQGIVAEAFRSLPERWQAVLWYTEVEKKSPKDIAPLLGLTANGVAALAYRAREALRQAYLQQHLSVADSMDCLAASAQLGAFVRGGLAKREHAKVEDHVGSCQKCAALVAELEDVNRGMRGIIAPLVLGVLGMGALEGGLPIGGALGSGGAAAAGHGAGGSTAGAGTTAGVAAGAATTGLAALLASASSILLPTAAAVGIVALVVSGASYLGVFNPLGRTDGLAPSPSSSPDATDAANPDPSTDPSTDPSVEPTAEPTVEPTAEPNIDDDDVFGNGTVPQGTGGATGGATGGQTGGNSTGGTDPEPNPSVGPTTDPNPEPSVDPTTDPDPDPTTDPSPDPTTDPDPDPTTDPNPPTKAALSFKRAPLEFLEVSPTSPAVGMTISNTGDGAAEDLAATITLPAGLTFAPPAGGGGTFGLAPAERLGAFLRFADNSTFTVDGWECELDDARSTASCTLDSVDANADATLNLGLAPIGSLDFLGDEAWTAFAASAGDVEASYRVRTGIAQNDENLKGTFVATGQYAATQVGGTVMGCDLTQVACKEVMAFSGTSTNGIYNNNGQKMVPLNLAGGEKTSGTTNLSEQFLPRGAKVKYALLEWSANRHNLDSKWTGPIDSARIKAPGGEYVTVTADEVTDLSRDSRHYYQARADVTELVAAGGRGTYSVADIAVSASSNDGDRTYYGGFTLTVVYELDSLPTSRVAVFAGSQWVSGSTPADFTFYADKASDITVGWSAWEADRGLDGDRLSVGTKDFTPLGWTGTATVKHSSSNAADATAFGSPFGNTLGVDAKAFATEQVGTGLHTLKAWSGGDNYLVSSMTVTISATK